MAGDAGEAETRKLRLQARRLAGTCREFDELDAAGQVIAKGPIWRFATDNGPATKPLPRDRVAGVVPSTRQLTWTPGRYAHSQSVYFGTNREAVAGGTAVLAKALPASATTCAIPGAALGSGKTYYWRVAEDNGAVVPNTGTVWAFRTADQPIPDDVTFFVGSDCHYGRDNNNELNRKVIDAMNWTPGVAMPPGAGGEIVRTPRGIVLCGDLLDKGFDPKTSPANWAEFLQDYGLTGADGRLGFPLYEGFGNHDGMTGPSFTRAGIKERNRVRIGLTSVSANGFHYSWDWDQVHLVQLNLFPGTDSADCIVGPPAHHPEHALDFLKEDLAKNVGDHGKVVIIFCHYCYAGGMADWWTLDAAYVVSPHMTVAVGYGHFGGVLNHEANGVWGVTTKWEF